MAHLLPMYLGKSVTYVPGLYRTGPRACARGYYPRPLSGGGARGYETSRP